MMVSGLARLTRDPELKYLKNNMSLCTFGIAFRAGQKDVACFWDCKVWGKRGETVNEHMRKGSPLIIYGVVELDQWEASDGQKREKVVINVKDFDFVPRERMQSGAVDSAPRQQREPSGQLPTEPVGIDAPSGDDIPF